MFESNFFAAAQKRDTKRYMPVVNDLNAKSSVDILPNSSFTSASATEDANSYDPFEKQAILPPDCKETITAESLFLHPAERKAKTCVKFTKKMVKI